MGWPVRGDEFVQAGVVLVDSGVLLGEALAKFGVERIFGDLMPTVEHVGPAEPGDHCLQRFVEGFRGSDEGVAGLQVVDRPGQHQFVAGGAQIAFTGDLADLGVVDDEFAFEEIADRVVESPTTPTGAHPVLRDCPRDRFAEQRDVATVAGNAGMHAAGEMTGEIIEVCEAIVGDLPKEVGRQRLAGAGEGVGIGRARNAQRRFPQAIGGGRDDAVERRAGGLGNVGEDERGVFARIKSDEIVSAGDEVNDGGRRSVLTGRCASIDCGTLDAAHRQRTYSKPMLKPW